MPTTPWSKNDHYRRWCEAVKAAGIGPTRFHDLRHTYASWQARAGTPMSYIAKAMGHADSRMTEKHYAHLQPDHVAETIRANSPQLGIETNVRRLA